MPSLSLPILTKVISPAVTHSTRFSTVLTAPLTTTRGPAAGVTLAEFDTR
ncbi:hypothetical protein MA3A0122R_3434 [Mycobacteroides abscessus 3A-0122-R]|uniref:Uncharacterized protein n=1 Tax=Mycobacteroides abscessus 21 TaxID=1299324 RepID=A0A829QA59_9MYCO|nr:hypothetical protein MA4S0303_3049 [Mycobacteroides abscessus 4S-0303]EIT91245.1 hypothetical protein MA4S0726RB_2572 [Mycobacteroides abscessus 4S-0726-RB]EIT94794.1 hypothetical protein MA4S0726RA_2982 [Mycobacteroides abscessus 4S-0726-RA]EIV26317.1 hypothetical protein MA3A0122R_3434 [Mycobacteroides abscessus 3A-0122-R]EIV46862.1 hypothetical protein MA4S0116R_3025 [Mycobacteroides abscessus 4S-0116-R]EIV59227.1 hypothetical protein MA4S0116S_2120 [Mycobacteroides abscessus 4S-0116-S]